MGKNRDIVDNSEGRKLVTYLKNKLQENQEGFDVATAFFNIEAFSMVRDELESVERFRLLLGKSPEFETDETLGDAIQEFVESDVEAMEFSKDNKESVERFIEFLEEEKVEVRLYRDNFLHGKAYIWDDEVVIGSSNFTAAGLTTNNELNGIFRSRSRAEHTKEQWFEKFWKDAQPFNDELIELLEESRFGSREYDPYDVFMKTLYEYQKEDLNRDLSSASGTAEVDLTEFQEDAVERVFTRLERYGGCMVADSVGLGKTYIATRVIQEFGMERNKNYLIVTPASLRDNMWRKEMKDMNMSENILSQEEVSRDGWERKARRTTGGNLEDVELVVVDESHNFRNPKSNKWENLFTILNEKIKGEDSKPYVLFLTATPINNSIWDLYWQLMLMLQNDRAAFIKEGIPDLYDKFSRVEEANNPSLLNDVMNEISVKRTREYIKENYPDASYEDDDGNEVELNFPERELNDISYALDESYRGYFERISSMIKDEVTMAYYRKLEYKDTKELTQQEEFERGRMKGMQGIFEKLLLKRLESSVGAFRKSINDHIDFLEKTKDHMENGSVLSKSTYRKYILESEGEIPKEEYSEETDPIDLDKYDADRFLDDIQKDIEIFERIEDLIEDVGYSEDAKIQTLERKLREIARDEQAIVFAYYSDTIQYVYEYLSDSDELDGGTVEMITGDSNREEREDKIDRYMDGEIDVILSTDVLSEGQNLQSAKHLINYDLHWNPTRMIQRAGRIDRIGTPHDTVWIHNFFPSDELEELLELVQTLENKISDIDQAVGMDQKVMDDDINPKVFGTTSSLDEDTLERIKDNDRSVIQDLSDDTLGGGEGFWQPIREAMSESFKQEMENIPYGVYSGHKREGTKGIFFYYKYAEDFHYWYYCDLETQEIIDNKTEILNRISVEPEEDRSIPGFFQKVYEESTEVTDRIEQEYKAIEQSSGDDRRMQWDSERSKKFLIKILDTLKSNLEDHLYDFPEDAQTEKQINDVQNRLKGVSLTPDRTSELRGYWRSYKGESGHGDWKKLADQIDDFLEDKSVSQDTRLEEFDDDKLQLVTVEFVS
jgi:superfamily II DNA or RNA helicase